MRAYNVRIATVDIFIRDFPGGRVASWHSGMAVDADGAPKAYAPEGSGLVGLDDLRNAGKPGDWYGLACDANGEPYIQRETDPAPGFYVSTTALADKTLEERDPKRYVDSTTIPYISIPPALQAHGARVGDVGMCHFRGRSSPVIVGDVGPAGKIGEGSMLLAMVLGIPESPKHGGVESGVDFAVFCGSRITPRWRRDANSIVTQVAVLTSKLAEYMDALRGKVKPS